MKPKTTQTQHLDTHKPYWFMTHLRVIKQANIRTMLIHPSKELVVYTMVNDFTIGDGRTSIQTYTKDQLFTTLKDLMKHYNLK